MCCLGQVSWMYKKMLYVVCKSWGCISTEWLCAVSRAN
jgi:hypothetical protein